MEDVKEMQREVIEEAAGDKTEAEGNTVMAEDVQKIDAGDGAGVIGKQGDSHQGDARGEMGENRRMGENQGSSPSDATDEITRAKGDTLADEVEKAFNMAAAVVREAKENGSAPEDDVVISVNGDDTPARNPHSDRGATKLDALADTASLMNSNGLQDDGEKKRKMEDVETTNKKPRSSLPRDSLGRPHHLLKHRIEDGETGEKLLKHFPGAATVDQALARVCAMSQRDLQDSFSKVYKIRSHSNNNNWLRKKIMEALSPNAWKDAWNKYMGDPFSNRGREDRLKKQRAMQRIRELEAHDRLVEKEVQEGEGAFTIPQKSDLRAQEQLIASSAIPASATPTVPIPQEDDDQKPVTRREFQEMLLAMKSIVHLLTNVLTQIHGNMPATNHGQMFDMQRPDMYFPGEGGPQYHDASRMDRMPSNSGYYPANGDSHAANSLRTVLEMLKKPAPEQGGYAGMNPESAQDPVAELLRKMQPDAHAPMMQGRMPSEHQVGKVTMNKYGLRYPPMGENPNLDAVPEVVENLKNYGSIPGSTYPGNQMLLDLIERKYGRK